MSLKRAAAYVRVSTAEQALHALSIPAQEAAIKSKATSLGAEVVEVFCDAGASATSDRRPEFQRLMAMATSCDRPFDYVMVYSTSRFARNQLDSETAVDRLKSNRVAYVSATQEIDDPVIRQIIAALDEEYSRQNSKKVQEMMMLNAEDGFWNGGPPPYGYSTEVAEVRGKKQKKRLVVDRIEADIVLRIFNLFLNGDGQSGPMGVKALTNWLNANGILSPRGGLWSTDPVHKLLTATRFIGQYERIVGNSAKFESEHAGQIVRVGCPSIVPQAIWDAAQAKLKAHNPKVKAPRLVAADHLLTGTSKCSNCSGPLIVTTGKSGKYRYYSCSTFQSKGRTACAEPTRIPVDELNDAVLGAVLENVLDENRLTLMLNGLAERQASQAENRFGELVRLEKEKLEAATGMTNLLRLVEKGLEDPDDELFAKRYSAAKDRSRIATEALSRARKLHEQRLEIGPEKIAKFSQLMREKLNGDNNKFRRIYLNSIIEKVAVKPESIHIFGRKNKLSNAAADGGEGILIKQGYEVPSRINEWRTREDSNSRPLDS